jgi:hypothetical protein
LVVGGVLAAFARRGSRCFPSSINQQIISGGINISPLIDIYVSAASVQPGPEQPWHLGLGNSGLSESLLGPILFNNNICLPMFIFLF